MLSVVNIAVNLNLRQAFGNLHMTAQIVRIAARICVIQFLAQLTEELFNIISFGIVEIIGIIGS